MMRNKYVLFSLIMTVTVAADQGSKIWIRNNIDGPRDHVDVIPGLFELVHYTNPGAAFGIMDNAMWLFAVFTIIALAIMVGMLWKLPGENSGFEAGIMGFITGGVIGNAIDRALFQEVTDFLRFYTTNPELVTWLNGKGVAAEWPSFNIADSAIVVGILVFVVQIFFQDRAARKDADESLGDVDVDEVALLED